MANIIEWFRENMDGETRELWESLPSPKSAERWDGGKTVIVHFGGYSSGGATLAEAVLHAYNTMLELGTVQEARVGGMIEGTHEVAPELLTLARAVWEDARRVVLDWNTSAYILPVARAERTKLVSAVATLGEMISIISTGEQRLQSEPAESGAAMSADKVGIPGAAPCDHSPDEPPHAGCAHAHPV